MAEYIEREALINEITQMAIDYHKDNSVQCNIAAGVACEIRNEVLNMPAADVVEVKHGKWIKKPHASKEYKQCNVCKYDFSRLIPDNYCPNCGARMDGDTE